MKWERILFDPGDRELVRAVVSADRADSSWNIMEYASELHPRGIIELVEPRSLRIVRSVMTLLDNFTPGANAMDKRLNAMLMLRDELCEGLSVSLKFNTARAVLELAKKCDAVLIIGSAHSSNARRLMEIARRTGVAAFLIDDASQITAQMLSFDRVGITSGASTPQYLFDGVVSALENAGFSDAKKEADS